MARSGIGSQARLLPGRLRVATQMAILISEIGERYAMAQTTNRFFDEVARLMNDAAGVAQGVKREIDTVVKTQAEKWLRDMDLVKREEFEAVKDMARLAREENEALKARIAALEGRLAGQAPPAATPPPPPAPEGTPPGM